MNGRIYDPLLGRMLSADLVVQFPTDLQSYNRYSYVLNNPLAFIDPTGFESLKIQSQQTFLGGKLIVTNASGPTLNLVGVTFYDSGGLFSKPDIIQFGGFYKTPAERDAMTLKFVYLAVGNSGDAQTVAALAAAGILAHEGAEAVQRAEENKPKTGSDDGKVKPGVKPYEGATYGELKDKENKGDGLDIDHQPSHASNVARAEQELGRPLTPEEAEQVRKDGPAIAVPAEKHRSDSPTYGGRNTPERIDQDKANPVDAARRDGEAMVNAADEAQKEAARKAAEENLERVRRQNGGK